MNKHALRLLAWLFLGMASTPAFAVINATYNSATDVPVTASSYTATGETVAFTLGYAPSVGTSLVVVKNTGIGFISGTFSNLSQGQDVALSFGGVTYHFRANYYGGTGNDLVLQWANTRAVAWGAREALGNNSTIQSNVPTAVNTLGVLAGKSLTTVMAGDYHGLALCSDATVAQWGSGGGSVPVMKSGLGALSGRTSIIVAVGEYHNLALCTDGNLAAWGVNNSFGQMGTGNTSTSPDPVLVNRSGVLAGKLIVKIAAGAYHTLALCSDGTLTAWGNCGAGELGNGSNSASSSAVLVTQTGVLAGKTVTDLAPGRRSSFVVCSDGTVAAWGDNESGQLGDGTTTNRNVPVAVPMTGALAGKTVTTVAAGSAHTLFLCSDGSIAAVGFASFLGDGSDVDIVTTPVAVDQSGVLLGKTVISIAAGVFHSVALCSDGTVAAWGYNYSGQLGDGTMTNRTRPVLVSTSSLFPGERFISISATGSTSNNTQAIIASPPSIPDIAVEQPVGTAITLSKDFGMVNAGMTASLTFTIRNTGTEPLTGLTITKDGTDQSLFTITADPVAPVAPGSTTTFAVQFAPTNGGIKTAAIHIATNVPGKNPVDITLTGTGTGPDPEIAVEQPAGSNVNDGATAPSFGGLIIGSSSPAKTFTVKNVGTADLTLGIITKDGTSAGDYVVDSTAMSAVVIPGGSTSFTVTFSPGGTASGTRTAAIHIVNNDANENPFDINLTGLAFSSTTDTDADGLNDWAEFQYSSLGFNWQVSQPALVSTLNSGANAAGLYTPAQVQALNVGVPLLQKNPTTGVFTLTVGVQKSTNLSTFNAFPMTAPQTVINGQGKLEFQFTVPDNAAFFKVLAQ